MESLFRDGGKSLIGNLVHRVFDSQETEECDVPFRHKSRGTVHLHVEGTISGDWNECRLVLVDVTARVCAEEDLRRSEERYRALVEVSSQVLYRMSADWSEMRGLEGGSVLADTRATSTDWFQMYIPEPDRELVRETVEHAIQEGTAFRLEHRVWQVNGSLGWVSSRAIPLRDAHGNIVEWFGGANDITERKVAEERIRRQNAVFDGIGRIFRGALACTEQELGKICLAVAEEVTGSRFGFIGEIQPDGLLHILEISNPGWVCCTMHDQSEHCPPPGNFKIHGLYGHVILEGKPFYTNTPHSHHASIGTPEGHPPLTSFLGVPLYREDTVVGVIALANREEGFGLDDIESVTSLAEAVVRAFDRKRAENLLTESQQRLSTAWDGGKMGMWEWTLATGALIWSPYEFELLDLPSNVKKPTIELFFQMVHPGDLAELKASIRCALDELRPWEHEFRIVLSNGQVRWLVGASHVLLGSDGAAEKMVGVNYDITDRKAMETKLRLAHDTLEQRVQERTVELRAANHELESFCYSVAHELGAPLRGINCFSSILLEEHAGGLDDEGRDFLQKIGSAALRLGLLVDDLLNLSRVTRRKLTRVRVDLAAVAREVIHELGSREPLRQVGVEIAEVLTADWDPSLAKLALQNLLGNAWKYTSKIPQAKIEFGSCIQNEEVVFFVRDNGIGFDMSYVEKIFLPFERLHRIGEYEGTGIGLATVQRIVTMHGGRIWAEAEEGKGATFFFTPQMALSLRENSSSLSQKDFRTPATEG